MLPAVAGAAWAFWSADVAPGGHGAAAAAEVGSGETPTATAAGSAVTVSWAPVTMTDGTPVDGYTVTRTGAGASAEVCGRVTGTTCTDVAPDGTWRYAVTAVAGEHWRGEESDPSDPVVVDTTGPTGGSVTVTGLQGTGSRYSTIQELQLALDRGSDLNGLAPGARLLRLSAPLTSGGTADGRCGTFETPVEVVAGTVDAVTDVVPAANRCYRYEYVVTDTFGNASTWRSQEVAVDTTPPSPPSLTLTPVAGSAVSGTTVWYRPGASGSFSVQAAASDTGSGVASRSFPEPASGWTRSVSGGSATYSWTGTPTAPGTGAVTARNHAGLDSAPTSFTLVPDGTPPSGVTVSYRDGLTTASRIEVTLDRGTDGGSGIGSRVLQRADAPLSDGVCGTFGAFATVVNGVDPPEPRLDPVEPGFCYQYRYVVTDRVGNEQATTSTSVAKVAYSGYADNVRTTAGLSSYWRLGEPTMVLDSFSGLPGAPLQGRSPEVGASWAKQLTVSEIDAVLTPSGRLRRAAASDLGKGAAYYSSLLQDQADYTVEADLFVASHVANDTVGLTARLDPTGFATGYGGWYDQATQQWQLIRVVAGVKTILASSPAAPLAVGSTHHVALDMRGSSIRLLVNGTQVLSSVDDAIRIGTGGVIFGFGSGISAALTDATGMHLDNFRITPALRDSGPRAAHGHYLGSSLVGAPGAPGDDENTAARFDGVDDEARATAELAEELSVELWFSSSRGAGTGATWRDAAGLLSTEDLGIGLDEQGRVVAGAGGATVRSPSGLADGAWHHVVLTRSVTESGGVLRLYVDHVEGAAVPEVSVDTTASTSTPLVLGRGPGGSFAGLLDEVALYSGALAPGTVELHRFTALGSSEGDPTGGVPPVVDPSG